MYRSVRMLLCSLIFGLCVTGCMLIANRQETPREVETGQEASWEQAQPDQGISREVEARQQTSWKQAEPGQETSREQAESGREEEKGTQVAWWSLIYERPNPERLPVRIHFRWAKGLESAMENRYNDVGAIPF